MTKAREVVLGCGFLEVRQGGSGWHAVALDRGSGRFLWIHVQHLVTVGDLVIDSADLLDEVGSGPVPEIAPEWLLWTALLRAIERQHVPERYRERLSRLAAEWSGGPKPVEQMLSRHGINAQELADAAARGDWNALTSTKLHLTPSRKGPTRTQRLLRTTRRLRSLLALRGKGLCVAVIGPDGAGKSTLVEGLSRTLPLRSNRIYMGLTGGKMRRAQSLRIPGLVFGAQVAVLWARYAEAVLRRADGQIVLFERYVLDGAVSAGTPLSRLQRLARRVQRWLVPPADLVLLLDATGRTMFDRKGEYGPETLESWRRQYRKLESSVRDLVVIDAERPAESVLRAAQNLIWDKMTNGHPTVPNESELTRLASELGLRAPLTWERLRAHRGKSVWRVDSQDKRFVLRILRADEDERAAHEANMLRLAGSAGLPVTPPIKAAKLGNRPVLLLEWTPGRELTHEIHERPWAARRLGEAFGEQQARIHHSQLNETVAGNWIDSFGPVDEALRERLRRAQSAPVLIHLDYYPANLVYDSGRISGILDWTNAHVGDPRADLARTWALMKFLFRSGRRHPLRRLSDDLFATGWWRGYTRAAGTPEDMPLFQAWAVSALIREKSRQQDPSRSRRRILAALESSERRLREEAGLPPIARERLKSDLSLD